MGIDWEAIENFFTDDDKLEGKLNKVIDYYTKNRGLEIG